MRIAALVLILLLPLAVGLFLKRLEAERKIRRFS